MWASTEEISDGGLSQKNDIQNAALRQTINIIRFPVLAQWDLPDVQQNIFAEEAGLITA